jgi:hypothetical protein
MTAKEWLFKTHPQVIPQWGLTGFDDEYMVRMMDEFLASEIERRIAERKNKAIGVDAFCDRLDNIFEMGNPTKAQIIDAYNKSVAERMPTEEEIKREAENASSYNQTTDANFPQVEVDVFRLNGFIDGCKWFRSRMKNLK